MRYIFIFQIFLVTIIVAQKENYIYSYYNKEIKLKPINHKYFVKVKDDSLNLKSFFSAFDFTISDSIQSQAGQKHFLIDSKNSNLFSELKASNKIEYLMPVFQSENGTEESVLNQFIVQFKEGVSIEQISQLNKDNNVKFLMDLGNVKGGKCLLLGSDNNNQSDIFELVKCYNENNMVECASPDFIIFNCLNSTTPNDPLYSNQWTLTKINAPNAWDITTGNSSIVVAVLDNGFDLTHEDFTDKFVSGWDYIDNDNSPIYTGDYAHGTECAGVIGAKTNNGTGISGIAWNCKIMPIRIAHGDDYTNTSAIISGINFAKNNGAQIISNSWAGGDPNTNLENAINDAAINGRNGKGCIVVFSSGNANQSTVEYPANLGNVLSVGATDQNDSRWTYSSYGSSLRVVAPSGLNGNQGDIWTTDISGTAGLSSSNYVSTFGGTSAACPLVAGLAALILSKNPNLTRIQVQTIIEQTAIDLGASGRDDYYGWGRIDAWNALRKTTSGTLPGHEVWRDTVNLTGNITVPSGVKLTVLSNATINLNSYSIVSTGGTITVESGATINNSAIVKSSSTNVIAICSSVQTAVNNWSSGRYIEISEGTFDESVSINSKNGIAIYGTGYDSYIDGTLTISNSTTPFIYGIRTNMFCMNNCTVSPQITGMYIYGVNEDGSFEVLNSSYCYLESISIIYSPDAISSMISSSTGELSLSEFEYHERGINFTTSSDYDIDNTIFCQNDLDIYTDAGSYAYTSDCTFSGTPASSYVYGNVSIVNASACGLTKRSEVAISEETIQTDSALEQYKKLRDLYHNLNKEIKTELKAKKSFDKTNYSNEFSNIITESKSFVTANDSSVFTATAVNLAASCYKQFEDYEGMKTFLTEIMENKSLGNSQDYAKRYMIDYYNYKQDYKTALSIADEILKNKTAREDLLCDVLFSKGLVYEYFLNNKDEAVDEYEKILNEYADNPFATIAKQQLKQLGATVDDNTPKIASNQENPSEFSISNHPNPFNPSTTISYTLPEAGAVQIKIYDILGREVAKLVDEQKSAGKYTVQWNGSNYASGIYFYSVTFNNQRLYKKMLMIK